MSTRYSALPPSTPLEDGEVHGFDELLEADSPRTAHNSTSMPQVYFDNGEEVMFNEVVEENNLQKIRHSTPASDLPLDNESENEPNEGIKANSPQHQPQQTEIKGLHKLSTFTGAMLVMSLISILGVFAFLFFLWSNPGGSNTASTIWLDIIRAGWIIQSITLSAFVLRTAVSIQAMYDPPLLSLARIIIGSNHAYSTCTSMLACIILERKGITLHASATVSMLRFINNGPESLVLSLRKTYSSVGFRIWIILLLYITTTLLQFSSTFLALDIDIGAIAGTTQQNATFAAMSVSSNPPIAQVDYLAATPSNLPTFAEYNERAIEVSDAIKDTGVTYRAFLPFANEQARVSMQNFTGVATILDSRVVCVRPKIHPGLSISLVSGSFYQPGYHSALNNTGGFLLNGTLLHEATPVGLIFADSEVAHGYMWGNFTYLTDDGHTQAIAGSQSLPSPEFQLRQNPRIKTASISQRYYMTNGPALVSSLDPRYPNVLSKSSSGFSRNPRDNYIDQYYFQENDSIPLMTGRSYQVTSVTLSNEYDLSLNITTFFNGSHTGQNGVLFSPDQSLNKLVITPNAESLVFTIPRIPGFQASVSLCYDSFASINANVEAISDGVISEPSLRWNASSGLFDTTSIRHQLGALTKQNQTYNRNYTDRGVLELHTTPQQLRDQVQPWYDKSKTRGWQNISFPTQNFLRDRLKGETKSMTEMSLLHDLNVTESNSQCEVPTLSHAQAFLDTMSTTGNTPLAWQVYHTGVSRLANYDKLTYFDLPDQPSTSLFQTFQFPRSIRGLIAVAVVMGFHLVLVSAIIIMFFLETKLSRIGDNAWQSVAQMRSEDLKNVFQVATMMKDDDVKKWLEAERLDKQVIGLRKTRGLKDSGPGLIKL
jgi:hypothetical protein